MQLCKASRLFGVRQAMPRAPHLIEAAEASERICFRQALSLTSLAERAYNNLLIFVEGLDFFRSTFVSRL
jgi:hypothetical protein